MGFIGVIKGTVTSNGGDGTDVTPVVNKLQEILVKEDRIQKLLESQANGGEEGILTQISTILSVSILQAIQLVRQSSDAGNAAAVRTQNATESTNTSITTLKNDTANIKTDIAAIKLSAALLTDVRAFLQSVVTNTNVINTVNTILSSLQARITKFAELEALLSNLGLIFQVRQLALNTVFQMRQNWKLVRIDTTSNPNFEYRGFYALKSIPNGQQDELEGWVTYFNDRITALNLGSAGFTDPSLYFESFVPLSYFIIEKFDKVNGAYEYVLLGNVPNFDDWSNRATLQYYDLCNPAGNFTTSI